MDKLDGQIERVVFLNEENGFCVLRVKVRSHKELVTVTGSSPNVNEGEWLTADGEWFNDPRHGRQFKAENMRTTRPDTLEGIEKYLASDLVKGIGKEYASRMVKTFGRDVFDVIENNSAKLLQVEGIGKLRKERIKQAWDEQKSIRQIMSFLFSHGISTSKAFRIHKKYGERAIEVLQRDPYCLARDIRGIGFLMADGIAMKLGITKDAPLRIRAGLEYTLNEITLQGHCAYPRNDLISKAAELLEADTSGLGSSLDASIQAGHLISVENSEHGALIYLPTLYQAECGLADRLKQINRGEHPCPEIDLDRAIDWVAERSGFELASSQQKALRASIRSKVAVVTGGPGVGKTTLVQSILMILRAKKMRVLCCAPTGRAAKRMSESTGMEAKTIHRLLQYNPGTGGFVHRIDNPLECDVLIIDESSMIDLPLAFQLVNAVPLHAAIVFVGDADQLPSVGPGRILQDIILSNQFTVSHLNKVFRQAATSKIITNAHAINQGHLPEFPKDGEFSDCYFIESEEPETAVAMIAKLVRESIPKRFGMNPMEEIQILTPMQKGALGARNLNATMQRALNPTGDQVERFGTIFRCGDRVMQTENDYDKEIYNGDLGYIEMIDLEASEISIRFDERSIMFDVRELDSLLHAYAITIHKSQGSEYPAVIIPLHTQHYIMLQRTLIYTAITRAKKLAILVGTTKALQLAVSQTLSKSRTTQLATCLQQSS